MSNFEKNTSQYHTNDAISATRDVEDDISTTKAEVLESREVFHKTSEGVDFRTVSWQRATVIFIKIQFAMSILAVPGALSSLGAVGGALSIVGWQSLNTCKSMARFPDTDMGNE